MRARLLFLIAAVWLCGFRCSLPWEGRDSSELMIVSYNAHNLFDDSDDGGEYPEFSISAGRWNADLYAKRLENAAAAIGSFSPGDSSGEGRLPDIVCLQEVESEKVLVDLAQGALKKGGYRWVALGGPSVSAIKCGVLSRYPFAALRAHSIADAWGFGPARDMLEVEIDLGSGNPGLTILICHWKSRREGEAATEVARRGASILAASRVAAIHTLDPGRSVIVCGDFNESPDELDRAKRAYATALMPDREELSIDNAGAGGIPDSWFEGVLSVSSQPSNASVHGEAVTLYSPWAGSEGFSYIFDGEAERLDGFLLSPELLDGQGLEFAGFIVSGDPALLDAKGEPSAWNGNSGFSDHLPIALSLTGLPAIP
ncbi:MAG: hypothetical protein CVV53_02750 [Spirochaetae bacterium HGW-Spirochaetae-9]|nr:MAG: hypothetical protein CVV53_02750 [Spirochaetae bacterium HGW-Spirochaetae-9]